MRNLLYLIPLSVLLCLATSQGEKKSLPQGYGISAKYPGDKGIDKDPAVIFF